MMNRYQLIVTLVCLATAMVSLSSSRADEIAEQLVLATYKVSNESSTASSVVFELPPGENVPGHILVTANHVFSQMKGNTCMLVTRRKSDDGRYQRIEIPIPIRENGRTLWKKHPVHDLAILKLPSIPTLTGLPLNSLVTPEQVEQMKVGDGVRLGVFPEKMESNPAGFPVVRSGGVASFPIVPIGPHPIFLVDTISWGGDSGGPVIHESLRSESDGPLVVGFVRGKRNVTDTTRESRFVERRTHYSLSISEVTHAAFVWDLIPDEWKGNDTSDSP